MRKWITMLVAAACWQAAPAQTLMENFANPPQEARPRVWWHWMDGNVSFDGIKKDLDWMERVGIGGIHQFDAGGVGVQQIVDETLPYGSPGWKVALKYAMDMARSKGMETAVASAPGWSSTGGPWVKPEQAMKKLTWRTMEVEGPGIRVLHMPELYRTPGTYQNIPAGGDVDPWFERVATLAIKLPDAERTMEEMGAHVSSSGGRFTVAQLTNGDFADGVELPVHPTGYAWIQYSFPRPQTIHSLTVCGLRVRSQWGALPPEYENWLEASDDGVVWKKVCDIPAASLPVLTMTIPTTRAKYFRLMVKNPEADRSLERFGLPVVEPTGTKIPEFVLHGVVKVNHAEDKAGFAAPHDLTDFQTPETYDPVVQVQDLSLVDHVNEPLIWKVPEGRWRIYRFGASLTGKKNHPAPPEATGLEVDKLDPDAWEAYFDEFLRIYEDMPVQYLLTDSYEAGAMTWTRNMFAEFKERRGYDLFPWLPALTGEVLSSTQETEQFLFDWRRTLGELFAENYDRLGGMVRDAGLKGRYTESHENGHVFVGDGMDLKRKADVPMSAIWMDNAGDGSALPMAMADIRESASVAHIYGQNLVAAESFTTSGVGGKSYSYCPANMKYTADVALSCGLNRFVIHESAHQPSDTHRPGLDLIGFGQWFNRHDTWAEEARAWTDYLSRSSYLLQQGRYKADILFYYGEDNSITGLFGHQLPPVPDGYSYDFIQPSGLLTEVFPVEGKLVTESGMSYRMLVLGPNCKTMSLPILRHILYLAEAGVPVCGTLPEQPASLVDHAEAFQLLLGQLKPLLLDMPLQDALARKEIEPDFVAPQKWAYVHRQTDHEDIYWIRNFTGHPDSAVIQVKAGKGQPRLLDPATGKIQRINASTTSDGYRSFQLSLEENDAVFVVIGSLPEKALPVPALRKTPILTLDGPWQVAFESGLGAPALADFENLHSYTESANPSIRYYSGTAVYRKNFALKSGYLRRTKYYELDLGDVGNLARVTVNGYDVGVAWKAPFRVEVPLKYLHKGVNTVEVKVINLWPNRIIGDLQPRTRKKWTYVASNFFTPDTPLLPSGLMGPVTLIRVQ